MSTTTVVQIINAPIEKVFDTIAHAENFSRAVPHIVSVEFLSDVRSGVGTRFRETRLMKGRQSTTELEVTEYVKNDRVRIVADAGGTIWDTVFRVAPQDGQVKLTLSMEARAYKLLARLMNPLIKGMVRRAIEADLDAVRTFCEQTAQPDSLASE